MTLLKIYKEAFVKKPNNIISSPQNYQRQKAISPEIAFQVKIICSPTKSFFFEVQ